MTAIMIAIAAAFVHTLAIMGYLSILGCMTIPSSQTRWRMWSNFFLRILLYVVGIGSIFLAPAYLYGQFKTLITNQMFMAFASAEVIAVIALFFSVKTLNELLPSNPKASEKRRP